MELYETESHYIILDGDYTLWCNRTTGDLEPKLGLYSSCHFVIIHNYYGIG